MRSASKSDASPLEVAMWQIWDGSRWRNNVGAKVVAAKKPSDLAIVHSAIKSLVEKKKDNTADGTSSVGDLEFTDLAARRSTAVNTTSPLHSVQLLASDTVDDVDDGGEARGGSDPALREAEEATTTVGGAVADGDEEEWFLKSAEGDEASGPHRLSELKAWAEVNHVGYDDDVQRGGGASGATTCTLIEALVAAGTKRGWYYVDADDTTETHGPYAIEQLREWFAEGHFDGDRACRCGRDGPDLTMAEAVAEEVHC
jgi:hypothetical protein